MPITTTVTLVLGIGMLLLGRKLFWFFVGAIGFLAGLHFAPQFVSGLTDQNLLIVGAVCGIIGVVLALFVQKVAIGAAGFLAGGYLAMTGATMYFHLVGQSTWIAFGLGGLIGALLLTKLFEWALILLSSAAGAMLIAQNLKLHDTMIVAVVLAVIGILVQARLYLGKGKNKE
jgi:hypothetical protein